MNVSECRRCGSDTIKYVAGLEQRIAELERDNVSLEYAIDTYASAVELKDKRIDKLYERIAERQILKRLLADAVRFIAYAQSKGVHGGEAIAKEIEENLNQREPCKA